MYEICQLQRFEHKIEAPVVAQARVVGSLHFAFHAHHPSVTRELIEFAGAIGLVVGGALESVARTADLARERDWLRTGVELCDEPLVLTDLGGGERRVNRAARELLERLEAADPGFSLDAALASDGARDGEITARRTVRLPAGEGVLRLRSVRDADDPNLMATTLALEEPTRPTLPAAVASALTPREREVAQLIAAGASNDAIAAELFLSPYTVKEHTGSVYRKTGTISRVDLTRRVLAG
ncbi:LuxR family transcriptional regulator [Egibacter rhizosphaerae]|uniref:LuxR family transcriptional regulator n=2 Tax=Egibacter rhizosphaerae TaxID=1670831 RepID=A0A411YLD5_9ACTN|nr:LuxR family transcriptional regulator [Egibacter rhizosphaerae]